MGMKGECEKKMLALKERRVYFKVGQELENQCLV